MHYSSPRGKAATTTPPSTLTATVMRTIHLRTVATAKLVISCCAKISASRKLSRNFSSYLCPTFWSNTSARRKERKVMPHQQVPERILERFGEHLGTAKEGWVAA